MYRHAGSPSAEGMVLSEFADHAKISSWATDAMRWVVQNGIMKGKSDNMLDPAGNITCHEVELMLQRYLGE